MGLSIYLDIYCNKFLQKLQEVGINIETSATKELSVEMSKTMFLMMARGLSEENAFRYTLNQYRSSIRMLRGEFRSGDFLDFVVPFGKNRGVFFRNAFLLDVDEEAREAVVKLIHTTKAPDENDFYRTFGSSTVLNLFPKQPPMCVVSLDMIDPISVVKVWQEPMATGI